MTTPAVAKALEDIYNSLNNDNENIDKLIVALKAILIAEQANTNVEVDSTQLAQNNRQGRKLLQSYFKQRGVTVTFIAQAAA